VQQISSVMAKAKTVLPLECAKEMLRAGRRCLSRDFRIGSPCAAAAKAVARSFRNKLGPDADRKIWQMASSTLENAILLGHHDGIGDPAWTRRWKRRSRGSMANDQSFYAPAPQKKTVVEEAAAVEPAKVGWWDAFACVWALAAGALGLDLFFTGEGVSLDELPSVAEKAVGLAFIELSIITLLGLIALHCYTRRLEQTWLGFFERRIEPMLSGEVGWSLLAAGLGGMSFGVWMLESGLDPWIARECVVFIAAWGPLLVLGAVILIERRRSASKPRPLLLAAVSIFARFTQKKPVQLMTKALEIATCVAFVALVIVNTIRFHMPALFIDEEEWQALVGVPPVVNWHAGWTKPRIVSKTGDYGRELQFWILENSVIEKRSDYDNRLQPEYCVHMYAVRAGHDGNGGFLPPPRFRFMWPEVAVICDLTPEKDDP
jgi:hypothetical protein